MLLLVLLERRTYDFVMPAQQVRDQLQHPLALHLSHPNLLGIWFGLVCMAVEFTHQIGNIIARLGVLLRAVVLTPDSSPTRADVLYIDTAGDRRYILFPVNSQHWRCFKRGSPNNRCNRLFIRSSEEEEGIFNRPPKLSNSAPAACRVWEGR